MGEENHVISVHEHTSNECATSIVTVCRRPVASITCDNPVEITSGNCKWSNEHDRTKAFAKDKCMTYMNLVRKVDCLFLLV